MKSRAFMSPLSQIGIFDLKNWGRRFQIKMKFKFDSILFVKERQNIFVISDELP